MMTSPLSSNVSRNKAFVKIAMPEQGTPEWHEIRRVGGITASEAAVVLHLSKWSTPHELYLLKRGLISPDPEGEKIWLEWGNAVEPLLLKMLEKRISMDGSKPDYMAKSIKYPWLCANLDWIRDDEQLIADAKWVEYTAGWGESGSKLVPDQYFIQVQTQLIVTGLDMGLLFGRFPNHDFRLFEVEADKAVQDRIINDTGDFWENTLKGIEPVATDPDSVKKQYPYVAKETVELAADMLAIAEKHKKAVEEAKDAERRADVYKAMLLQQVGENCRGVIPGWEGSITRSKSADKQVPEKVVPAHVQAGRLTTRINHPSN